MLAEFLVLSAALGALAPPPLAIGFVQQASPNAATRFATRRGHTACFVGERELRLVDDATRANFVLAFDAGRDPRPELSLPGELCYFQGNDPSRFACGVRHYERVRIADVAPQVDFVVRVDDAGFEYDVESRDPHALAAFEFTLAGAESIAIAENGDLVVTSHGFEMRHSAPRTFAIGRDGARHAVPARFQLRGDLRVGFGIESDRAATGGSLGDAIVVDPGLSFATYLGSTAFDEATAVAVDSTNATVFCGATNAASFPVTTGAYDTSFGGTFADAFVAKISSTGQLVFATFFGGSGTDGANALAIGSDGKIHVAGRTQSTDLPTSTTAFDKTGNGGIDGFVAALASDGKSLFYSSYLGGAGDEEVTGIAVNAAGDIYLTGYTGSADFPITPGVFDPNFNGGGTGSIATDAFVARLSPLATALVFATYYGGAAIDEGHGIALLGDEPAIVGRTESTLLPLAGASFDATYGGGNGDGFVARFSGNGAVLASATYVGGSDLDSLDSIAANTAFGIFVGGFARSLDVGIPQGLDLLPGGQEDGLLVVFDAALHLQWGSYLGGSLDDRIQALAVDPVGAAFVVGRTASVDFPALQQSFDPSANGGTDAFFSKIRPGGAGYNESGYLGGAGYDEAEGVAIAAGGVARIVGRTTSTNFPVTAGAPQATQKGSSDAFVAAMPTAICANAPSSSIYGLGKPGSTGIPSLAAVGVPAIPSTAMILRINGALPGASAILFVGLAQLALPFDKGLLLVNPFLSIALPPIGANGRLDIPTAFGEDPGLCGVHVDMQVMYFDPGAAGPYHTAQSNGLEIVFGS